MFAFERKLNLLIGIPSGDYWISHFGMALTNMMGYLMSTPVPGFRQQRMVPFVTRGSILSRSRANIVKEGLKQEASHILFVDTDQDFPRDTAHRLLQHGKDVVGCNIAVKQVPSSPTARARSESPGGDKVFTDPDSPPLEMVWRLGTGIMLIDMRVFKKIGPRVFQIDWKDELQDYQGEDWSMCEAIQSAGYKIWVDHTLSNEVGHWGLFRYTHDVVGEKEIVPVFEEKQIGVR